MTENNLNIWSRTTTNTSNRLVPTRTEASMRDELYSFLYGRGKEIPKATRGIYRKVRVDDDGLKMKCACVTGVYGDGQIEPPCPYCDGLGFYFDEVWFDYYKVQTGIEASLTLRENFEQPGRINVPHITFYTTYDLDPVIIRGQIDDRVVVLKRDVEGNLITPYERIRIYRIGSAIDLRSDNGRLEFWKLTCFSDDIDTRGTASDV